MPTLRLKPLTNDAGSHGDEVLACAYSPDSKQAVSGGWDGHVRIWDVGSGAFLKDVGVSKKPVSAAAVTPDGTQLVTGTLDGMLTHWNANSLAQISTFLAHSRPISSIIFLNNGETVVTSSWDQRLVIWKGTHAERSLDGHGDIVAGCQASLDEKLLFSWSYDQVAVLWDLARPRDPIAFHGHGDRVLSGSLSPDNHWAATGSRDAKVILWDVAAKTEKATLSADGEVRFCGFLRDGQSLLVADATGRVGLYAVPTLEAVHKLETRLPIQCGALAPAGAQLAVGCGDGLVHFIDVEGFDDAPLLVMVQQAVRHTASALQKFFGKTREVTYFTGKCPACLAAFELGQARLGSQTACSGCRRKLQVAHVLTPP